MATNADNIKILSSIPPQVQEMLKGIMLEKHFRRGEVISDQMLLKNVSFFLIKGMARGFYTRKAHDYTYDFAFDGDSLGVPMSLFQLPDATPAIEFLEATDVLIISRPEFTAYMENADNDVVGKVLEVVVRILFDHVKEIEEQRFMFQSMNAPERYEWFVGRYPAILERATITQIASFLGLTKETIYRIRAGKYRRPSQTGTPTYENCDLPTESMKI